uniref:Transmembrane protein 130 n=1 Tax=Myotis lucifugus TaxID=59463 RepID=G1NZM2_MYOLU
VSGLLGLYELHLATDSPATTGAEVNITASLVASDNGSLVLPTDPHSYRFHWVHSPLMLKGKTEEAFRSTIRAVGNVPGDFPIAVWVTSADCQMCQPVARSRLVLSITDSGCRETSAWLVMTEMHTRPLTPLCSVELTKDQPGPPGSVVEWRLWGLNLENGLGSQGLGSLMLVCVFYTSLGLCEMGILTGRSLDLRFPARSPCWAGKRARTSLGHSFGLRQQSVQAACLTAWNALGSPPLSTAAPQSGSPPLTMCWRIKSECLPLEEHECRPVSVASTVYNVTTIIMDPGDYCFSIRAENVISRTHQYHRVQVWPSRMQPAVFAFPCATIITMMLAFIMYMTLRNTTQQKDMVENPEPPTEAKCCQMCCVPFLLESPSEYLEVVRENHGLLPPLYKSVKTYTV